MSRIELDGTNRFTPAVRRAAKSRARRAAVLIGIAAAAFLSGCAARADGERVFLRQNRASAALTYAIVDAETYAPELVGQLYDAESALNHACAPLQEAGGRGVNQEQIGLFLRFEMFGALDGCEEMCHEVEELVWRLDPEIAETYLAKPTLATSDEP